MRNSCIALISSLLIFCSEQQPPFDAYNGYKKLTGDSTGYFHLGRIGENHFLFTPEGNAFRALGINHFHMITTTDYEAIIDNIKKWGFNAGCYQGPQWMWNRYPYTQGITLVDISYFYKSDRFKFQDVFSQDYLDELETKIKRIVQPQSQNKMLIGYFWTDIPVWTKSKYDQNWISFFKALPPEAAGRKVWDKWKKENPGLEEKYFVALIARHIYSKVYEFLRTYDNNHLIFGDRYLIDEMPDFIVSEAMPFIDAIAIQPPARLFDRDFFDNLYSTFDKPIYIADHVTSYATKEHPKTMGQIATDAETYVHLYSRFVIEALSTPYIIGFNKCHYQDEIRANLLKQGLVHKNGEPYTTIDGIAGAKRALKLAYEIQK